MRERLKTVSTSHHVTSPNPLTRHIIHNVTRRSVALFLAAVPVLLTPVGSVLAQTPTPPDWAQTSTPTFTVFYSPGFGGDRDFAIKWLTHAEGVMKGKYRITNTGFKVSIYLYPTPNEKADVGHAQIDTSNSIATIHYLSPSASSWTSSPKKFASLGVPYDDNHHAKVLVSEYIPLAHVAVQEQRPKGGWRYRSGPAWIHQGLQEYDAIFHSTEFNKAALAAKLREFGRRNVDQFICCQDGLLNIADVYNGGALFWWYLAERFGEDIHRRLLSSGRKTFAEALNEETGVRPEVLQQAFMGWITSVP